MSKKQKLLKDDLIALLRTNVQEFNHYREEHEKDSLDLTFVDLTGANLCRANLSNADLTDADLSFTYLHSANLQGANLSNLTVGRSDLSEANLSQARLENTDFSNTIMYGANLTGVKAQNVMLAGAKVREVNFTGADLSYAKLSGLDFSGANFNQAILHGADFEDSDLSQSLGLETAKFDDTTKWTDEINLPRGFNINNSGTDTISFTGRDDKIGLGSDLSESVRFLDHPELKGKKASVGHNDYAPDVDVSIGPVLMNNAEDGFETLIPLPLEEEINLSFEDYKPPSILTSDIQVGIQEVKNQLEKQKNMAVEEQAKNKAAKEKPKESKLPFLKPKPPVSEVHLSPQVEKKIDDMVHNVNLQLSSLSESLYVLTSAIEAVFSEGNEQLSKEHLDHRLMNLGSSIRKLFIEAYKIINKMPMETIKNQLESVYGISQRIESALGKVSQTDVETHIGALEEVSKHIESKLDLLTQSDVANQIGSLENVSRRIESKLDLLAETDVIDQVDQLIGNLEEEVLEYSGKLEKYLKNVAESITTLSKNLTDADAVGVKSQAVIEIHEMLINLESNLRLDQELLVNKLDASTLVLDNISNSVDDSYSTLYQKAEESLTSLQDLHNTTKDVAVISHQVEKNTQSILETVQLSKDTHETVTKILTTIDLIKEIEGKVTTVIDIHKLLQDLEGKVEHIDTIHPIVSTLNIEVLELKAQQAVLAEKLPSRVHGIGKTVEQLVAQYQKGLEELHTIKDHVQNTGKIDTIAHDVEAFAIKLDELIETKHLLKYVSDLLNNVHSFSTVIPDVQASLISLQGDSGKLMSSVAETLERTRLVEHNIDLLKNDIHTVFEENFAETNNTLKSYLVANTSEQFDKLENNLENLLSQLDIKLNDTFAHIEKYSKEEIDIEEKQYKNLLASLGEIKAEMMEHITYNVKNHFDHIFKFLDSFNNKYDNMVGTLSQFKNELTVFTYKFAEENSHNSQRVVDEVNNNFEDIIASVQALGQKVDSQCTQSSTELNSEKRLLEIFKQFLQEHQKATKETIQNGFKKFAASLAELESTAPAQPASGVMVENEGLVDVLKNTLDHELNKAIEHLNKENKEFYNRLMHNLNNNLDGIQSAIAENSGVQIDINTMDDKFKSLLMNKLAETQSKQTSPPELNEELRSVLEFLVDQTSTIKNTVSTDARKVDDLAHKVENLTELVQLLIKKSG